MRTAYLQPRNLIYPQTEPSTARVGPTSSHFTNIYLHPVVMLCVVVSSGIISIIHYPTASCYNIGWHHFFDAPLSVNDVLANTVSFISQQEHRR